MNFLNKKEKEKTENFMRKGYLISQTESRKSLAYISNLIKKITKQILKKKNINLNNIHRYISVRDLNEFRLKIIQKLNQDSNIRFHYFNLSRNTLYQR